MPHTRDVVMREPQAVAPADMLRQAEREIHEPHAEERAQLFVPQDLTDFRERWKQIQIGFVDEPKKCVQQADELVSAVIQRLTDIFGEERKGLERTLSDANEPSTEELRVALRKYRSFFDRLLTI